jgi:hypothetical protein
LPALRKTIGRALARDEARDASARLA